MSKLSSEAIRHITKCDSLLVRFRPGRWLVVTHLASKVFVCHSRMTLKMSDKGLRLDCYILSAGQRDDYKRPSKRQVCGKVVVGAQSRPVRNATSLFSMLPRCWVGHANQQLEYQQWILCSQLEKIPQASTLDSEWSTTPRCLVGSPVRRILIPTQAKILSREFIIQQRGFYYIFPGFLSSSSNLFLV